jgi:nicotinamide mononucleotide transporter
VTLLALISFVTGVAGVWLTIRQHIACWPMALISVVTSAVEFYRERLYGDMSLQAFYFAAGVYGWIFWQQHRGVEFNVTSAPRNAWPLLTLITAAASGLIWLLLRRFGGDRPAFDAVLTAGSLVATYMMTRKWIENWAAWVVIDGAYVVLYLIKGMWIFALLYLFFTVMAGYGFFRWKRLKS